MKLHERLPESVTVDGKTYALDLDFRNVLLLMETLARDDLIPGAKAYRALKCVMQRPPKNAGRVLEEVKKILFPDNRKQKEHKKLTDFDQDADLIRAAFMQAYHINLFRDRLHWLEFTCYLSGLPEGSRYCDILGIRARPMPAPTKYNQEEREWLMKAKSEYALNMSAEEETNYYAQNVRGIAAALIAWAKAPGGEENNA